MAVSQETIQKIKSIPISSIVKEEGGLLRRVGREFVTHCLWHKDTNPSLTINDDKGFLFCHVCQQNNDAVGYVREKHGLGFRDACERISSLFNFQCIYDDEDNDAYKERQEKIKEELESVNKKQKLFREHLSQNSKLSIPFLQSRGIKPETSREFELGFDRNEKRITIPVYDYKGRHVGFSARAIDNDIKPKYKNSENNLIFNKSEIVFNEFKASNYIREIDSCVFVEGHLDVIAMWQAGVKNVVALQGTASPSENIIRRLRLKTKRFILLMDGDAGGNIAIAKFIDALQQDALDGNLDIKIASLPKGEDPDSYIQSGGDISACINNATPWMDWLLDTWLADLDFQDSTKFTKVENQIKDLFSKITSPALRAYYFDKASIRLAQNKQGLAAQIAKSFNDYSAKRSISSSWSRPDISYTRKLVERRLLRLYLHKSEFRWLLRPLMDRLYYANNIWLWNRIKEIESVSDEECLVLNISAILAVSDIQYIQDLRTVLSPSIEVNDDELSVAHIEEVMMKDYK